MMLVACAAMAELVLPAERRSPLAGLPPAADQPFSFRGVSGFEMTEGKIQRDTEYWDAYAFLVQLGGLPVPAASTPTGVPQRAENGIYPAPALAPSAAVAPQRPGHVCHSRLHRLA
jgi:hypothetical protein